MSVRFSTRQKKPRSSSTSSTISIISSSSSNVSFDEVFRKRSISRSYSVYVNNDKKPSESGIASTFGKLVVLKVLMVDLAVSLGDAVTDILQGVYLICWYNEHGEMVFKTDTWRYGVCVLVVCWVPGLVCVIHILTHYRSYQLRRGPRLTSGQFQTPVLRIWRRS